MLTSSQKEKMLLSSIKDLGMNENRVPHCKEAKHSRQNIIVVK
jgi:hypothetical protein